MLLAIDTATRTTGLALHDGAQVLAELLWVGRGHHTVEVAPEIGLMLRRAGTSPQALTAVAVAHGPGSYNGLRAGMALAKGLALAFRLPMVGIGTLEILARAQPRREGPMVTVLEAGRGRVAARWYKSGRAGWQAQGEAVSLTWDEALARVDRPTYVCGEIPRPMREVLVRDERITVAEPSMCLRRPGLLAELAWERLRSGKPSDPAAAVPVYLPARAEAA